MYKRFTAAFVIVLLLFMIIPLNALAAEGSAETLTIKGDGVSQEIIFSRAQLEAMASAITKDIYSAANNFPTEKTMYRKGVSLLYLLEQAGMKGTPGQLKFISSDGYTRTFTYEELVKDARYYYSPNGSRVSVPTIIAFADSSKGFNSMSPIELVLTMGQRVKGEQNNPWFVKYLQTIEVISSEPDKWPQVTFSQTAGTEGMMFELKHSNYDAVKIYYTLDGSDPDINSTVYNVSASYYQPDLNRPILVKGDTEIRAIAIGAGKRHSLVSSSRTAVGGEVFTDLEGYSWARTAIENLCGNGIINGMGDSRFAPGEPLTRAQFAKMIIIALGETTQKGSVPAFKDIKTTDWHFPYVQKAAELGLLKGYPDGNFRPDQSLSREEMLAIMVQSMGVEIATEDIPAELLRPLACENRISDWARPYAAYAENLGILEHGHMALETGSGLFFNAREQASRAEAAMTLYLMLNQ